MLKRSVVLGGLVAGAFLLPAVAGAGVVNGVCSVCHTMHSSQNGVSSSVTGSATLLTSTGCVGCHASAADNTAAGIGNDGVIGAPQVDNDTAGSGGFINNGGYFTFGGTDGVQHNVAGIMSADATMIGAGATDAPGDTAPMIGLGSGATPNLDCSDCHGSSGGHHGTGGSTYRLLSGTNGTTSAQVNYGATAAGPTVSSGDRSAVSYNATDMNLFCAGCHGMFHTAANQDGTTLNDGVWVRHPTDVSVDDQQALGATQTPSLQEGSARTYNDEVVVGTSAAGTDTIMCLSCHVPHGGPNDNLLSFAYNATTNAAGDNVRSSGCETCHSYGAGNAGM